VPSDPPPTALEGHCPPANHVPSEILGLYDAIPQSRSHCTIGYVLLRPSSPVDEKALSRAGYSAGLQEALDLFMRRVDDPGITISHGFEANFESPHNEAEQRIKAAIDEHRARTATKLEATLFAQKTRLNNAERSLKEKETKKAREDVRIATSKIETIGINSPICTEARS
jgi:hypothetical protein